MTAQEKAKQLVDGYWIYLQVYHLKHSLPHKLIYDDEAKKDAKQCALIAVDEHFKGMSLTFGCIGDRSLKFWQEVKQEIEKM
jgi:hypothetical protein